MGSIIHESHVQQVLLGAQLKVLQWIAYPLLSVSLLQKITQPTLQNTIKIYTILHN